MIKSRKEQILAKHNGRQRSYPQKFHQALKSKRCLNNPNQTSHIGINLNDNQAKNCFYKFVKNNMSIKPI